MSTPTSLPAYMGFILKNLEKFKITERQTKDLQAIKLVIRPKAHPFKDAIIEIESTMSLFYKEQKSKAAIEKLSVEASKQRINFATIKMECRDQVIWVITNVQWQEISKAFSAKMAYQTDNSLENVCAIIPAEYQQKESITLQTAITTLEKEIQEMSLNTIAKDVILDKVYEMENKRQELVSLILQNRSK